MIFGSELVTAC